MYYKELLFNTIVEKFNDQVKRFKIVPTKHISDKIKIPINDVGNYITANPALLFYYFDKGFNTNMPYIETFNIEDKEILEFNGIFLGHALSPYKESLGLLLELGSFMRISENFNFSSNRKIMLAGVDWVKKNWVVKNLGLQKNLKSSYDFRIKLYKLLNIEVFNSEMYTTETVYDHTVKYVKVKQIAEDYEQICKVLFGEKYLNRKLENQEKHLLLKSPSLETIIKGSENKFNILGIDTIKDIFQRHLDVIYNVIKELGRIDADTFEYFLLQRYHQHKYSNYLKFGVKREMSFDKVFDILDSKDEFEHKIGGVYHSDYYYKIEDDQKLTVHPYYFPSGKLYDRFPNPKEAEKRAILLSDTFEKILNLISELEPFQTAVIISDLLSFNHFCFFNDSGTMNKIELLLKKLPNSTEIEHSWSSYTKDWKSYNDEIDLFSQSIFSSFIDSIKIPYYFFPYLIALDEMKEGKINENVRSVYSDLIFKSLEMVIDNVGDVSWT